MTDRHTQPAPWTVSPGSGSADEVALLAEVIVQHRPVDRGEFLQGLHPAKALHDPFSASGRQVGILDPIVQPAAGLLAAGRSDLGQRRLVGSEAVGDDGARASVPISSPS
jgi:hypothetical protein